MNSRSTLKALDPDVLQGLGIHSLDQALAYREGTLLRETPGRETWQVPAPDGRLFFLKRYRSLAQARGERRGFRLLEKGTISIPQLQAWGEASGRGAFLLWEGCPGTPLDEVLRAGWPDLGQGNPLANRKKLILVISELVQSLHGQGLVHHDLYLCHLLYQELAGGNFQLHLLDLQRVRPRRLRCWFVKDLAALLHSAPETVSRSDGLRFLLHYLNKDQVDRAVRSWVRSVRKKAQRMGRHKPKYG